ncbi:MAG TPA: sigma-70 family RNA polymerase sigma factor [Bacillota bacterium]|nr:sigma-70 family RNA polymerase sigma factor [Bacillota bacterium]
MDNDQLGTKLLTQMAQGSKQAFNRFYETYITFVLNIAMQILGDLKEAEDLCHDIFLDIYQHPKRYDPQKGSVKAWLAVKTRSRSIDRLRKRKPVLIHKLELLETEDAVRTEWHVLNKIEKEILLEALRHIPEKQRKIIYGVYFENKTQRELAETLDQPLGTIKSSIRYGLRNMRKQKSLLNWAKSGGE